MTQHDDHCSHDDSDEGGPSCALCDVELSIDILHWNARCSFCHWIQAHDDMTPRAGESRDDWLTRVTGIVGLFAGDAISAAAQVDFEEMQRLR